MIRTPRSAACARSALHSRSNRTWSATAPAPAKRRPVLDPVACSRSRKRPTSAGSTGAPGSARSPRQLANAEADAYGEPNSSGGFSGSTCHQRAAGGGEPVDERERLRPETAARERRRMELHPAVIVSQPHAGLFTVCRAVPAERIHDLRASRRRSTAAAGPRRRCVGDRVRGRGDHRPRRPRDPPGRRPLPPPEGDAGARRRSRALGNDRFAGSFEVDAARPLEVRDRGLGRPPRRLARRARPQGRRGPGRPERRARRGGRAVRAGHRRRVAALGRPARRPRPARRGPQHRPRGRRRAGARAGRRLVRAVPALVGRLRGRRSASSPSSPSSASTSSTSRRSTRSAGRTARGATTR